MNDYTVDIIIPTYNRAYLISETINSVMAQTFKPKSIIIIDDGSTDNTREVIESYKSIANSRGIKITYAVQSSKGVSAARNEGIKRSSAKYLLFLDSDDLLEQTYLEQFYNEYNKVGSNRDLILYTSYDIIDSEGYVIFNHDTRGRFEYKQGNIFEDLLASNIFIRNLAQVLFTRISVIQSTRFDTSLTVGEDWDFLLHIAKKNKFKFIDNKLLKIREHQNNTIANKKNSFKAILDFYRKWIDIGVSSKISESWGKDIAFRMLMRLPKTDFYKIVGDNLAKSHYRDVLFPHLGHSIVLNSIYYIVKQLYIAVRRGSVVKHIITFLRLQKKYRQ